MLRIDNLKLPVGAKEDKLRAACAHALRVSEEALVSVHLLRRSIDAREGVKLVCSCAVEVKNESSVLRHCKNKNVQPYAPKKYTPPAPVSAPEVSPVVIGAGPAGLFCALLLACCGARPILLERGRAVEQRKRDVEHFWRTGELDLTSNVQFGEGGAGAFSDGKLNTGTKDLRHGYILEEFVRFGASEDILVDAKPHVGTDKLYVVLQNLRREIIDRGGEVRFSHKVVDIEQNSGSVTALPVIETQAGDVSAYIPTNVISITDGQIFLESNLFFSGMRPAVNVGLSVSRVGGAAQTKAMKKVAGSIRIDLAQYREMEVFTQFSSDLDSATKAQLDHGEALMELLKQPLCSQLSLHEQVITLCLANAGVFDKVGKKNVKKLQMDILGQFDTKHPEIGKEIDDKKVISDEMINKIVELGKEMSK